MIRNGYSNVIYLEAADTFLKEHMEKEQYASIMNTRRGKDFPYVAARLFLNESDWRQYLWIAHHGSLEGFNE